jgi:hypothetical protein
MTKSNKSNLTILALGFLGIIFPLANSYAAEFSADMVVTQQQQKISGKIYVSNKMMRQEMSMNGMQNITIVDGEKKKVWVVMPQQKMYMEMGNLPQQAYNPATFDDKEILKKAKKEVLGKETIEGHVCDKIRYTFHDKSVGVVTQWISTKIKFPLKVVAKNGKQVVTVEYKNITTKKNPNKLFVVPAGFKKMEMPSGMPPQPH